MGPQKKKLLALLGRPKKITSSPSRAAAAARRATRLRRSKECATRKPVLDRTGVRGRRLVASASARKELESALWVRVFCSGSLSRSTLVVLSIRCSTTHRLGRGIGLIESHSKEKARVSDSGASLLFRSWEERTPLGSPTPAQQYRQRTRRRRRRCAPRP